MLSLDGYVAIDMERNVLGLFEVSAKFDGTVVRLIVDTAAAQTILTRSTAERVCALEQSAEKAAGVSTTAQNFDTGRVEKVTIGRMSLGRVHVLAIDLEHVNQTLAAQGGARIDGLLGADLLSRRNAIIDYRDGVLYLEGRAIALRRLRESRAARRSGAKES